MVGSQVIVFNALTLCNFIKTRSLRTRKHVMVINLTVADLLFGAFLPILLVYILKPTITPCYVGQILTTFSKTGSLITLVVIAVERMHAVIWPIRHQGMGNRVYKIALVVIWVLSAALTATVALVETLFRSLLAPMVITTATVTIVACHLSIWTSFRRRKRRQLGTIVVRRDSTLAVTLLMVTGFFPN